MLSNSIHRNLFLMEIIQLKIVQYGKYGAHNIEQVHIKSEAIKKWIQFLGLVQKNSNLRLQNVSYSL